MNMAPLQEDGLNAEIEEYEAMRADLESKHTGEWVLLKNRKVIGFYDSMERAAQDAVRLYGRGPYLIRQVGAPPVTLPASVMYQFGV
jgi:hypothetical protein